MRSGWTFGIAIVAVIACCSSGLAQNLLINGGFENNGTPCDTGNGWVKVPGTNNCLRDGTTHMPGGSVAYEGVHWGSVDQGNPSAFQFAIISQTVTLPGAGYVHLVGALSGMQSAGSSDHFARVHDGPSHEDAVIAEFFVPASSEWAPFDVVGAPTGSEVTVTWGWDNVVQSGWNDATASHLDGLVLTQLGVSCTGEPTVTGVTPKFATNDGTVTGVTVSGTNFDGTSQVILRRFGSPDIEAIDPSVSMDGTSITCSLPLSGAAMGKWNVVVTKNLCNEALLNNALIVAVPTLTNGSFEDLVAPASCPNPPAPQDAPLAWLNAGVATAANLLIRDSDQYPPPCPRPDGNHYASMMVPQGTSFGFWRTYQYIAVTPGEPVTVCGEFAGGGTTNINLRILEGDENGERIGERLIEYFGFGCEIREYGWVPACVTATPAGGLITIEWALGVRNSGDQVNVSHADDLVLIQGPPPAEVCNDGIDNDGDRAIDCQDDDCAAAPGCDSPPVEICDNGIDDDGDVWIDCWDSDCDGEIACLEICDNGIDDDGNCEVDDDCEVCDNSIDDNGDGLTDCDDPKCLRFPGCGEVCDNGADDDNDGFIDCLDDDCIGDPACPCTEVFADPDEDGDVDHEDFGLLQLCVTGPVTGDPQPLAGICVCFDRDADRDVDQVDVAKFESCATGPMVPLDINNPPAGCNP